MANNQSWAIFWLLFLLYMFDYMVIVSHFPLLKQDTQTGIRQVSYMSV